MRNKICKELNNTDIGKLVNLCGWVDRRRDHGGVIFIDLRDHSGFLQITINPDDGANLFKQAETLRNETVIMVSGIKSIRSHYKFNLRNKKLEILPKNHKNKLTFVLSLLKNCGFKDMGAKYKCSLYKPLISENLIR